MSGKVDPSNRGSTAKDVEPRKTTRFPWMKVFLGFVALIVIFVIMIPLVLHSTEPYRKYPSPTPQPTTLAPTPPTKSPTRAPSGSPTPAA